MALALVAPFIASAIACVDLSVCSSRQSASALQPAQPSTARDAPQRQAGSAAQIQSVFNSDRGRAAPVSSQCSRALPRVASSTIQVTQMHSLAENSIADEQILYHGQQMSAGLAEDLCTERHRTHLYSEGDCLQLALEVVHLCDCMPVAYQGLGHDLDCILQRAWQHPSYVCRLWQGNVTGQGARQGATCFSCGYLNPCAEAPRAQQVWPQPACPRSSFLRLPDPAYHLRPAVLGWSLRKTRPF